MSTILIVDDSPTSLFDIKRKLLKINPEFEILDVESYDDALKVFRSNQVDLAFIDLQMPVKNGADLIMYMKEHESLKAIPTIILTGTGEDSLLRTSLESIVDAYLHKYVDMETLTKITQKYLKNE